MSIISKLRNYHGANGFIFDGQYYIIQELLRSSGGKLVDKEFKEGGRWTNFKSEVYKITGNNEVAYFKLIKEEPATEIQEGMDCEYDFIEVIPKEVITYEYIPKSFN